MRKTSTRSTRTKSTTKISRPKRTTTTKARSRRGFSGNIPNPSRFVF